MAARVIVAALGQADGVLECGARRNPQGGKLGLLLLEQGGGAALGNSFFKLETGRY
jgi:hypothetical protein